MKIMFKIKLTVFLLLTTNIFYSKNPYDLKTKIDWLKVPLH